MVNAPRYFQNPDTDELFLGGAHSPLIPGTVYVLTLTARPMFKKAETQTEIVKFTTPDCQFDCKGKTKSRNGIYICTYIFSYI